MDIGHDMTCIAPFNESYLEPHAVQILKTGGHDIDLSLASLLETSMGIPTQKQSDKFIDTRMKERLCYVPKDYEEECGRPFSARPVPSILQHPTCVLTPSPPPQSYVNSALVFFKAGSVAIQHPPYRTPSTYRTAYKV